MVEKEMDRLKTLLVSASASVRESDRVLLEQLVDVLLPMLAHLLVQAPSLAPPPPPPPSLLGTGCPKPDASTPLGRLFAHELIMRAEVEVAIGVCVCVWVGGCVCGAQKIPPRSF